MKFCEAKELMMQGLKIKMPNWSGYWAIEDGSIKMHTKDGRILDIRESEDIFYTLKFIISDEWIVADETNSKLLQGEVVFTFDFSEVHRKLYKAKLPLCRKGWNAKGIFIYVQFPDEHSKMSSPYIYIDSTGLQTNNENAPRVRVPWVPSQTDLSANDWMIYTGYTGDN